jgi:hypothetical protein
MHYLKTVEWGMLYGQCPYNIPHFFIRVEETQKHAIALSIKSLNKITQCDHDLFIQSVKRQLYLLIFWHLLNLYILGTNSKIIV